MSWEKSLKKKSLKKEWNNRSYHQKDPPAKLFNGTLHDSTSGNQPKQELAFKDDSKGHVDKGRALRNNSSVPNSSSVVAPENSFITIPQSKFYSSTKRCANATSNPRTPSGIVRSPCLTVFENNQRLSAQNGHVNRKVIKNLFNTTNGICKNNASVRKKAVKNGIVVSKNSKANSIKSVQKDSKHKRYSLNCKHSKHSSFMEGNTSDMKDNDSNLNMGNIVPQVLTSTSNGQTKQNELQIPQLKKGRPSETNLSSSEEESGSAANAFQVGNKQVINKPLLPEDTSFKKELNMVCTDKVLAKCENGINIPEYLSSGSELVENTSSVRVLNAVDSSTNEKVLKLGSVNKSSVSVKNKRYKNISPVMKNSISKSLRNRIKLKSNLNETLEASSDLKVEESKEILSLSCPKPVSEVSFSAENSISLQFSSWPENCVVSRTTADSVLSQVQTCSVSVSMENSLSPVTSQGENCNISTQLSSQMENYDAGKEQKEILSTDSETPCEGKISSVKVQSSDDNKTIKKGSKTKKTGRFLDSIIAACHRTRVLRAKAKTNVLRSAKLNCRMRLLCYHQPNKGVVATRKDTAGKKPILQLSKHKTVSKSNSKTKKSMGIDVQASVLHDEPDKCQIVRPDKKQKCARASFPLARTSKCLETEENSHVLPPVQSESNGNDNVGCKSGNPPVKYCVPKSISAKMGVKSNSSPTTVIKSLQIAKKTLQTSNSINSTSVHGIHSPSKKKKKHKYFRGGRYSLTINGVMPKKRRRVSDTSASVSSGATDVDKSDSLVVADSSISNPSETALVHESINTKSEHALQTDFQEGHSQPVACDLNEDTARHQLLEYSAQRQVAKKSFIRSSASDPVSSVSLEGTENTDDEEKCDSRSFYDLRDYFSYIFSSPCVTQSKLREKFQIQCLVNASSNRLKSDGDTYSKKAVKRQIMKNCLKSSLLNPPKISEDDFRLYLRSGDLAKIIQFLGNGANPNHVFVRDNNTPLHIAASIGHRPLVQLLMQAGSHIESINSQLRTPLMLAVEKGFYHVVQYLLLAGANVLCKDISGMTPFHMAAKIGYLSILKLIYKAKSYDLCIDEQDDGGWTALVWACEHGHYDVVQWLLDTGADPDVKDRDLNRALHWAAFSGNEKCVAAILEKDINVNAVNKVEDTALHIASRKNHYECVFLLVSNGAATNMRNQDNLIPLLCCTDYSSETWKYLQNCDVNLLTEDCLKSICFVYGDVAKGKEKYPIEVVNDINQEQFSLDFTYITRLCESPTININRNIKSMNSCSCLGLCSKGDCSCTMLNFGLCYGKNQCLVPDFNIINPPVIFECSKICSCDTYCLNRVVQHGLRYHFQLFRTEGKGWGVRCLSNIPKGAFVCEYLGELLTEEEFVRREDDSYMFELDSEERESYYIDAKFYGNVSRFLNHSCSPNLTTVKVFTEHQDLHFPHIAFFSNREIEAKEELCFDYGYKFWMVKSRYFLCLCGSQECKYSSLTISDTLGQYCSQQNHVSES